MGRKRRAVAVAAALFVGGALTGCEPVSPWTHELITVNAAGDDGANADTFGASFSPDGTKVVFATAAYNLGPNDSNFTTDVYLRDLTAGTTTLVTKNSPGTDAGNGASSLGAQFSPDGTKILFDSTASDLVANDTNGAADVFLYDVATESISLVSVNAVGTASAAGSSIGGQLSPDGTKVAFTSIAGDFGPTDSSRGPAVPDQPHPDSDIYVRDLTTGVTTLATTNAAGTDSANKRTDGPEGWSPDGSHIVFTTAADNLGPADANDNWDVYTWDVTTGTTQLVSANAAGTSSGNLGSSSPAISPDGTRVLFSSHASDLGPAHTSTIASDLYLRDLTTATTTMVSVNASGIDGANESVFRGSFNPDGNKVLFNTAANNLGPTDTNPWPDIYLRDLAAGTTTLVSANAAGTDASEGLILSDGVFSPDGSKVAFTTFADDLGPKDTASSSFLPFPDVYVKNLYTGFVTMVSARADGKDSGNGNSFFTAFSPDSTRVLFSSRADNLGPSDQNTFVDLYAATLQGTDVKVLLEASPDPVPSGDELTYTLDVQNIGPRDAPDTLGALLVLPEGVSFVDVRSSSGTCTPPEPDEPLLVTCEFGTVGPRFSAQVWVTATVTAPAGSVLEALAGFGTSIVDPDPTNNLVRLSTSVV